jgi:hypothetical protein
LRDDVETIYTEVYAEVGNHQDLLAQLGHYWRLYQFRFYQRVQARLAESVADY